MIDVKRSLFGLRLNQFALCVVSRWIILLTTERHCIIVTADRFASNIQIFNMARSGKKPKPESSASSSASAAAPHQPKGHLALVLGTTAATAGVGAQAEGRDLGGGGRRPPASSPAGFASPRRAMGATTRRQLIQVRHPIFFLLFGDGRSECGRHHC